MMSKIFTMFAILSAAVASAVAFNATKVNPSVAALEVAKYTGLWYQMYADQIVMSTFERNGYCVTAIYGDNGDGTLSVHNYQTVGSPSGTQSVIDGYAYIPDASKPGELMVHFDVSPADGAYWVIELGPEVNSKYDYAIVSDNISFYLYVLVRDPATFRTKYEADVLSRLATDYGFTGITKPIETYQKDDCVYEANRRANQIKMMKEKLAGASA